MSDNDGPPVSPVSAVIAVILLFAGTALTFVGSVLSALSEIFSSVNNGESLYSLGVRLGISGVVFGGVSIVSFLLSALDLSFRIPHSIRRFRIPRSIRRRRSIAWKGALSRLRGAANSTPRSLRLVQILLPGDEGTAWFAEMVSVLADATDPKERRRFVRSY